MTDRLPVALHTPDLILAALHGAEDMPAGFDLVDAMECIMDASYEFGWSLTWVCADKVFWWFPPTCLREQMDPMRPTSLLMALVRSEQKRLAGLQRDAAA